MISSLNDLIPVANVALWHGFMVFLRVAAMVSLLPAFGEQSVPRRVKLAAAICFTLIVAPAIPQNGQAPDVDDLAWLCVTESIVGLALGLGIRLFVLALQIAGAIAAQSTSLSQILGGASADPVPAMGHVLVVAALALAVMSGLHVKAAEFVILSYSLIPAGDLPDGSVISSWGLGQIRQAFSLAFSLAAPFVILSMLYNLALGAINKAMPQLMVAFVGAPVITAGGLILLALAAPVMLGVWISALNGFLSNPFVVLP